LELGIGLVALLLLDFCRWGWGLWRRAVRRGLHHDRPLGRGGALSTNFLFD